MLVELPESQVQTSNPILSPAVLWHTHNSMKLITLLPAVLHTKHSTSQCIIKSLVKSKLNSGLCCACLIWTVEKFKNLNWQWDWVVSLNVLLSSALQAKQQKNSQVHSVPLHVPQGKCLLILKGIYMCQGKCTKHCSPLNPYHSHFPVKRGEAYRKK